jgi:hypothetical protein
LLPTMLVLCMWIWWSWWKGIQWCMHD